MKKKFIFTEDSTFTHVKDKMHQEVTEHIVEDDQTKKLYHHVVSYGSWFHVSYESIFMSHLLKELGVDGFCLGYAADDCDIYLPWYPQHEQTRKSVVELPDFADVEDFSFGISMMQASDEFIKSFLGKSFKVQDSEGRTKTISGEDFAKIFFGSSSFPIGFLKDADYVHPLKCVLYGRSSSQIDTARKILESTDILEHPEICSILQRFSEMDLDQKFKMFEDEVGSKVAELRDDLLGRQQVVKKFISKQNVIFQDEKL